MFYKCTAYEESLAKSLQGKKRLKWKKWEEFDKPVNQGH